MGQAGSKQGWQEYLRRGHEPPWRTLALRRQRRAVPTLPEGDIRGGGGVLERRRVGGLCLVSGGDSLEGRQGRKQSAATYPVPHVSDESPVVAGWDPDSVHGCRPKRD